MNNAQLEVMRVEVAKLELRPGDTMLLKLDTKGVSREQVENFQWRISRMVPQGVRVMVIDSAVDVSILKAAEAA